MAKMQSFLFAIFDEEPIACEGDDENSETIRILAYSVEAAELLARKITKCAYLILWDVQSDLDPNVKCATCSLR